MQTTPRPTTGTAAPERTAHEQALMALIAAGDRGAFEALYRAYFPRLRRFVDRMTRRPALTEEVVNDTMLAVWRKAQTYDGVSKVSTWIFAIAYRQALKALKRVDPAVALDPDFERCAVSPEAGPEDELQQRQLHTIVAAALAGLSPEQRAVVELTYYQGYAWAEIAEIVGCPVGTVKTRMFHARRRLKSLLAGHPESESWVDAC